MTTGIEAIGALTGPQQTTLGQVTDQTVTEQRNSDVLSDMSATVLKTAFERPGAPAAEDRVNNFVLQDSGGNAFIAGGEQPDAGSTSPDRLAEKLADLYNDLAIYQVAWSIAKRTGRDIETLLKAQ